MPESLSVAIITYNEEQNIARCLESVSGIADEIVVVDSFSTDRTEEICRQYNVRFIKNKFPGHIEQKNIAKDACSNELVLSLDADEALSAELKTEIKKIKENGASADGYQFNRLTFYVGIPVRHCGWYPDKSLRLWKKQRGKWGGNNPHDKFFMSEGASVDYLKGDLLHYSFHSIDQHLDQVNKFSTISAKSKFAKHKRSSVAKMIIAPFIRFVRMYFLQCGFLDGFTGLLVSAISAHAVFLKYAKLFQMQKAIKY